MAERIRTGDAQFRRMTETPMPRLIGSMAVPSVAAMLVTTLYNMADTYFVSQLGTSASASVGVVFAIMSLIQAAGGGFGMGAGSLISRRLGEKKEDEASMYASCAFFGAFAFGLLLAIVGLCFLTPLVRLLGSTDTMLPYSRDYARYILMAAPVMCSAFVLNASLRAEGASVKSMVGMASGGLLNIALDPLLIFTFQMGISGAAVATAFSQLFSFVLMLFLMRSKGSVLRLGLKRLSRHPRDYLTILRTGFPTICRQGLASAASALMTNQAAVYGDAAVAAVTISNRVYLLVRNVIMGVGQGYQPVAGYNFGAGLYRRVKDSFRVATIIGTVICCSFSLLLLLNAPAVIALFRRDDPEVIRIGTLALYFAAGVMPLMAYSTYVNQLYQCLGFVRQATLLAACRQGIFFIPLMLLLPALLGLLGVQMGQPAADLLTFVISVPFQIHFYRKELNPRP